MPKREQQEQKNLRQSLVLKYESREPDHAASGLASGAQEGDHEKCFIAVWSVATKKKKTDPLGRATGPF